jgi:uncharacterized protein YacL
MTLASDQQSGSVALRRTSLASRYLYILLAAVAIQIIGRGIDGYWHATHDEFESASDQLQAHSILWVGVLVALVVSGLAVTRLSARPRAGYLAVLISSIAYAGAAVWHFIEHANGSDPAIAHVVLGILWAVLLASAALTAIMKRRPHTPTVTVE